MGNDKSRGEHKSQCRAHVRDHVEELGERGEPRLRGHAQDRESDRVERGHDQRDKELAAHVGREDSSHFIEQWSEGAAEARRSALERAPPAAEPGEDVETKNGTSGRSSDAPAVARNPESAPVSHADQPLDERSISAGVRRGAGRHSPRRS